MAGRKVRAPEKTIAVPDHNVPTTADRVNGIENPEGRIQVAELDKNAREFGLNYYPNYNIRLMLNWSIVDNDEYAKPKAAYGGIVNDDFDEYQVRFQFAF